MFGRNTHLTDFRFFICCRFSFSFLEMVNPVLLLGARIVASIGWWAMAGVTVITWVATSPVLLGAAGGAFYAHLQDAYRILGARVTELAAPADTCPWRPLEPAKSEQPILNRMLSMGHRPLDRPFVTLGLALGPVPRPFRRAFCARSAGVLAARRVCFVYSFADCSRTHVYKSRSQDSAATVAYHHSRDPLSFNCDRDSLGTNDLVSETVVLEAFNAMADASNTVSKSFRRNTNRDITTKYRCTTRVVIVVTGSGEREEAISICPAWWIPLGNTRRARKQREERD